MTEQEIRADERRKCVDLIEVKFVSILDKLMSTTPNQSAGLFGVSIGMMPVLAEARKPVVIDKPDLPEPPSISGDDPLFRKSMRP